jgi:hypothetical protein
VRFSELHIEVGELLPEMCWSADGQYVFLADTRGALARLPVPAFRDPLVLAFGVPFHSMTLAQGGLVLAATRPPGVLVFDPETLKLRAAAARLGGQVKRVTSAPGLDRVFLELFPDLEPRVQQQINRVEVLDLRTGNRTPFRVKDFPGDPVSFSGVTVAPDGRALYSEGPGNTLLRFPVKDGTLQAPQRSQALESRRGIWVSPDSSQVYLSGRVFGADLQSPRFALPDGTGGPLGFDPVSQRIFACDGWSLATLDSTGAIRGSYQFEDNESIRQILVHPTGNKLLLLTDQALRWVEFPTE